MGPDVQLMLDTLQPLPAVVYNGRYDVLGTNGVYRAIFYPGESPSAAGGNALWQLFTGRLEDCPLVFREAELRVMVATLRSAYGNHVGEPGWERFVRELCRASPEFAGMWASGDVVPPGPRVKTFRHRAVGELRLRSQFAVRARRARGPDGGLRPRGRGEPGRGGAAGERLSRTP